MGAPHQWDPPVGQFEDFPIFFQGTPLPELLGCLPNLLKSESRVFFFVFFGPRCYGAVCFFIFSIHEMLPRHRMRRESNITHYTVNKLRDLALNATGIPVDLNGYAYSYIRCIAFVVIHRNYFTN